jgi:hypothetical protein
MEKGMLITNKGQDFFVHKRIIPAVKMVQFVRNRVSYINLKDCWCVIILLNMHASTEDKGDDITDSFCEELKQVFDHFPRYNMKILLGDFNAKGGREGGHFKPIISNESIHKVSNVNGVRVVKFPTSKTLSRAQHSHTATFINTFGPLLMVSHIIR